MASFFERKQEAGSGIFAPLPALDLPRLEDPTSLPQRSSITSAPCYWRSRSTTGGGGSLLTDGMLTIVKRGQTQSM